MKVLSISSDLSLSASNSESIILVDSTDNDVTINLPYAVEVEYFLIKRVDSSLNNIILSPKSSETIEGVNGNYMIDGNLDSVYVVSNKNNKYHCVGGQGDSDLPTIHFDNQQAVNNLTLANPLTLDPAVAARYGQLNVHKNSTISVIHIHQMRAGSGGTTTIEFYRRRDGSNTYLGTGSLAYTSGDFATTSVMFTSASLKKLKKGDYLFMQPIDKQSGATADGLTCDVHFSGSRSE